MKKIFLLLILLSSIACSNETLIGKWEDIIKLSQKKVFFDANENTITITTEGEWWWINAISLNNTYIDFSEIDTTLDNYSIVKPEFTFERIDATIIKIKMSENLAETERILRISIEAGDYFDGIVVTQSAL